MARAVESAIVNGSRQGTHQDNNFEGATSPVEKAWDGLRRIALERGTDRERWILKTQGATRLGLMISRDLIEKGGHYLIHPDDCLLGTCLMPCIRSRCGLRNWRHGIRTRCQQTSTGLSVWILGRPVVVSGEYPLNLHTDGTNDATAANNIRTGFSLFNKMQFMIGNRRAERTEQFRDPLTGFYYLVTTCRKDFQTMENRRNFLYSGRFGDQYHDCELGSDGTLRLRVGNAFRAQSILGVERTTETDRDTWLEGEINRQTARIESFLDRKVQARVYRQDLNDDFQGDCLYLENTPILEVQNLWRDADREFDDDARIPSTDYSVYRDRVQFASRYSVSGYGAWWQNSTSLLRTIRIEYVAWVGNA